MKTSDLSSSPQTPSPLQPPPRPASPPSALSSFLLSPEPPSSPQESSSSQHIYVTNLNLVSLESLVRTKLQVLFDQQREADVDLQGVYDLVMEQVEKPLLEIALSVHNGNQVKTSRLLGINRNTLKKKIDLYQIKVKPVKTR